MGTDLFQAGGISYQSAHKKIPVFLTFAGWNTDNKTLSDVIVARAPLAGVTISDTVDYSLTKALDRGYLVSVFGDAPVQIVLKGLHLFDSAFSNRGMQLPQFYQKYKASKNLYSRVDVGLSGTTNPNCSYRCIMTGLALTATAQETQSGYCTYTMQLIGVQL